MALLQVRDLKTYFHTRDGIARAARALPRAFRNGGDEEFFIGSADAMKRNLESRVETVVPVESPDLQRELRRILDTQLKDDRSAWEMQPDGSYVQRQPRNEHKDKSSQQTLIERAEKAYKDATRLRKRTPQGIAKRPAR